LVFGGLIATFVLLGLLARWAASTSAVLAWVFIALIPPACAVCAVAIDRILPLRLGAN
jgi:hypothetical protein